MSKKSSQSYGVRLDERGRYPEAITDGQRRLSEAIDHNRVIFAIGPAGSGKTYVAVSRALTMLRDEKIDRILLTRPVVEAGESLGFLPGTLEEKINPYLRPLYDAIQEMTSGYQLQRWLTDGKVEIAPLAYMRGRTLNNACIILDEAQNASATQIKMVLTRIGHDTKVIVTGDLKQVDVRPSQSGLRDTERILSGVSGIRFIHLGISDIVRDDIVADIVEAYEADEEDRRHSGEDSEAIG